VSAGNWASDRSWAEVVLYTCRLAVCSASEPLYIYRNIGFAAVQRVYDVEAEQSSTGKVYNSKQTAPFPSSLSRNNSITPSWQSLR